MYGFPQQFDPSQGKNSSIPLSPPLSGFQFIPESSYFGPQIVGTDATAQTLLTLPLAPNRLGPGKAIWIRALCKASSASTILMTMGFAGANATANANNAEPGFAEILASYADDTHINFSGLTTQNIGATNFGVATTSGSGTTGVSSLSSMNSITVSQQNVAVTHLTLFYLLTFIIG